MEIYLVRHTTPGVAKGVCYGQADLDVTDSFEREAAIIREHLPAEVTAVYSSPLMRCKKLAEHLYTNHEIQLQDGLKEINCGEWELKLWDEIPKTEIDPWMNDLENVQIPGGESYKEVFKRAARCFDKISRLHLSDEEVLHSNQQELHRAVIVAHGGVIRSILSHITQTPLLESFKVFSLHYGCVVKIVQEQSDLRHEVLSNIAHEKETHKPSHL